MAEQGEKTEHQGVLEGFSVLGIRKGFAHYKKTIGLVFRERLQYGANHLEERPGLFPDSLAVCAYGLLLAFLLYVPVIAVHGLTYSKIEYILWSAIQKGAIIFVLHGAMKLARGKGSLRQTASACLTAWGLSTPLATLLLIPSSLAVPAPQDVTQADIMQMMANAPAWALIWMSVAGTLVGLVVVIFGLAWFSAIHRIRVWRVFWVGALVMIPANWALTTFVYPALQPVVDFVGGIGDLIL